MAETPQPEPQQQQQAAASTEQVTTPTPSTKPHTKNPKRVVAGKTVAEKTRQAREAQKKLWTRQIL